jgi:hypothetical protein
LGHDSGEWVEHFNWVVYLANTGWLYSGVSVFHYFTLFITVGSSVPVDLRVLGLAGTRKPVVKFAEQVYPWMWGAFCLAILSGALMAATDAGDYLPDIVFRVKMTIIFLALVFTILLQRSVPQWVELPSIPVSGKIFAFLSLIFWVGSILAGVEIAAISGLG